jgi:UDP-glucose 4-epimerase
LRNNIVLTGCSGFIGRVLLVKLKAITKGRVIGIARSLSSVDNPSEILAVNIDGQSDFFSALAGIDTVIHAAARAHIMDGESPDSLVEYRKVNVEGTLNLASQAASAGVKRFIFISTIGVNGLNSHKPYTENDSGFPHDSYSVSKHEAEVGLRHIATETGLEVVIIRPPLVYGKGAVGSFGSLLKLTTKSIPLPFGSICNKRSMIYVGNLADFIIRCIDHPAAANQTFLISDVQDMSLRELITYIRQALYKPLWLLPVPVILFRLLGKVTNKSQLVNRLIGDLQVDSSKARRLLDWAPPFTVRQGIAETVLDLEHRKS